MLRIFFLQFIDKIRPNFILIFLGLLTVRLMANALRTLNMSAKDGDIDRVCLLLNILTCIEVHVPPGLHFRWHHLRMYHNKCVSSRNYM